MLYKNYIIIIHQLFFYVSRGYYFSAFTIKNKKIIMFVSELQMYEI